MKTKKAIFLDRDGTIIIDKNYLSRVDDIAYFPDTFKALRIFQELGYALYIVTNQSGVGRGYFTMTEVNLIHHCLQQDMKKENLRPYNAFQVCPHHPEEGCDCRKPFPKMINEIMVREEFDPKHCYMLGDKVSDAECGKAAGIHGVLVRTDSLAPEFPHYKTMLEFAQTLEK